MAPDAAHCAAVGGVLARMHEAGRGYARHQPNLRGLAWWIETVPAVLPFLDEDQRALMQGELAFQRELAASPACQGLPAGPIHADLFRDNAMFDGGELSGLFDFYFAGVDHFVYDIAICLNDWCVDLATGRLDEDRANAFVGAYDAVRALTGDELRLLPAMMRGGAFRFWLSRLWDLHLPRDASMLEPHDPTHFERMLRERIARPWHYFRT
jgi:homoserine kinase type II